MFLITKFKYCKKKLKHFNKIQATFKDEIGSKASFEGVLHQFLSKTFPCYFFQIIMNYKINIIP